MEGMQQVVSQVVLNVTLAALALLFAYCTAAVRKFKAKMNVEAQQLQNEEQRNLLIDAMDDLENLTTKTVKHIEQTTAQALRQAVKNGTKDRSELEALGRQAFNEIAAAVRPEAKELLEKNFGNFSSYLIKTIESKVFELKNGL